MNMTVDVEIKIALVLLTLCVTSLASPAPVRPTSIGLGVASVAPSCRAIDAATDRILLVVSHDPRQDSRDVEETVRAIVLYGPPLALLAFIISRWTRRVARQTRINASTSRIRFYGLMLVKMSWRVFILFIVSLLVGGFIGSAGEPYGTLEQKTAEATATTMALLILFLPPIVLLTSWTQTKRRFLQLETVVQEHSWSVGGTRSWQWLVASAREH